MAGDAFFSDVSLLLHFYGANGSALFTDNSPSPKTISRGGNAAISTAQSKFGGSSAVFDGAGDYLLVPSDAAFTFGTGDFTVETHIYVSAYTDDYNWIIGNYVGSRSGYWAFYLGGSGGNLEFRHADATVVTATLGTAIGTGAWKHVAVTRQSGLLRFFLDGVMQGGGISFPDNLYSQGSYGIGSMAPNYPNVNQLNGYLDELRVTRGVARYIASFTPPTAPHPDGPVSVSGTVYDDTGAPCAREIACYSRATKALVGSGASDPTTGAYSVSVSTTGEVIRVVFDDSAGVTYNDLIDRVIPV